MKVWIQRVTEASVTVENEKIAEIGLGYLILLGVAPADCEKDADELSERIATLRIFEDEKGRMNRSIEDVGGSVIVVSQFTLYADTAHGRRPGFSTAARPEIAEPLYERVVANLRVRLGQDRVGTGRFGADMKVALVNDGPCSFELTSPHN
ncbi:MAG: D-tyrosyl-tRNA(Tyr) deacylase [Kiritimatiellae bacterium]|nr:D-tyrosyl-tRNA(Tyr) deacylase [Kiritimatiellia bacterium]